MDSLNRKLSNLEKLRRYLDGIIPDIYDQKVAALVHQSSIYRRYTGLCYSLLKESVIAENGFREYGKIQSDSERKIPLSDPDEFCEINHDTLERISSGLNEESLVFFTSFYKRLHSRSNINFETELFAYSMLFWILRGKKNAVGPKKARRIAFMFIIAPNILPYIYRWLHKRKLSPINQVAIRSPRLDMLITVIDKNLEELNAEIRGTTSSFLAFLEQKNVIARVACSDKFIIATGRGSLTDLFNALSRYSYEIAEKKIMFPRKEILFDSIVKNENLERFTPATISKMYSTYQEISWLFYNLPSPDMVI